jgi:DNA modification methylase
MPTLHDIDLVLNDPPFGLWGVTSNGYGKIRHSWDVALDWDRIWQEIWRVLSPTGTAVICAGEPLASRLAASQGERFLYRWHWFRKATNIFGPKWGRPLNVIEPIGVYSQAGHRERTYNPQPIPLDRPINHIRPRQARLFRDFEREVRSLSTRITYHELKPIDLIEAPRTQFDIPRVMHGQKPVSLMRYLIRVYSHPGDTVLDFTAGSFTTAVACALEGRKFVMIEQHRPHYALGVQRLKKFYAQSGERN